MPLHGSVGAATTVTTTSVLSQISPGSGVAESPTLEAGPEGRGAADVDAHGERRGDSGQLDSWGLEICVEVCEDSAVTLSGVTIDDSQAYATCSSITVEDVTVDATGELTLYASPVNFINDVVVHGELSAGNP